MRTWLVATTIFIAGLPAASAQPGSETGEQAEQTGVELGASAPDEATLGGAGESCRARADCRSGLRCVNQVCADEREGTTCGSRADCGGELVCVDQVCRSPLAGSWGGGDAGEGGGAEGTDDWLAFRLEGAHPFVGISVMGGPAWGILDTGFGTSGDRTVRGAFLFALRGGVLLDRHELAIEISPMTFWYYEGTPGPTFQLNGTYGHWLPLYESSTVSVYWPLRFGVGLMTGNTGDNVFFQARLDLVSIAIRVGHFFVDMHLPSFRYELTGRRGNTLHFFYWQIGASLGYVF